MKGITRDTVHHHQGTIGHPEGRRNLGREVNVTRRIDEVDEEAVAIFALLDEGQVFVIELIV